LVNGIACNVDGLVLWRDLKNVCPVPMPIEKPNMKLTIKSQIDEVRWNYRQIANKSSLYQCPAAIATKPNVICRLNSFSISRFLKKAFSFYEQV
jgi:hypothetical protein